MEDVTKIRPLADRVLIERIEADTVSKGGIVIPDNAKEKPNRGKVITVGPGKFTDGRFVETTVKVGQTVLFGKYAGQSVIPGSAEKYVLLREDDIHCVLED
jgi:chaperonin GroES